MKKKLLASLMAIPLVLMGWTNASAQEDEDKSPYVLPVDTFTCSYNDGKGPGDLKKAIASWNEWMDEQGATDYGAFVLTPYYYGADTFELGWLGYWTSQEAMGEGIDAYLSEGKESAKGFAEVLTCETHEHWAVVNVKPPKDGPGPDKSVFMFANCSLEDDTSYESLFESLDEAVAYQEEHGYTHGSWFMWPVFGGGGESEFDFKAVSVWDNYTEFGKAYQHNANGGGRQAQNEIMGDKMDCDASRVYNAMTVRRPADDSEE